MFIDLSNQCVTLMIITITTADEVCGAVKGHRNMSRIRKDPLSHRRSFASAHR